MCKDYKIKNFTTLSNKELLQILKWRNHIEIRKWMKNSNLISKKEHFSFINKLKKDNKNLYFLVDDIGVIYFNLKNNEVTIGLYKNPSKEKVGSILLQKAIEYGFNKLKAKKLVLYVYEDNQKAINLYKKFGFKKIAKKDNLIRMELENSKL